MEETIKVLEEIKNDCLGGFAFYTDKKSEEKAKAIETLLQAYKEDERVIEEMSKKIADLNYEFVGEWCKCKECSKYDVDGDNGELICNTNNFECIKQYFRNKVKEENKE